MEQATRLSIFKLKEFGLLRGYAATTLTWTRRLSGHKSSIGILVDSAELYAKVNYTITDRNTSEKTDYDYKISLTTTPCNFGGVRYWFICPLSVNGVYCGRRVGTLYLASGGHHFGCRHCYNLSYESRNEPHLARFGGIGYPIEAEDVVEVLRYLFAVRGAPEFVRSDNGPEFASRAVKRWLRRPSVQTLFIAPGSPWENGYVESYNEKLRDELLNGELFVHIDELRYAVDRWRMDYNHYRPHSSLSYMTPAGFAELCRQDGCIRAHTPGLDGVQDCGILS